MLALHASAQGVHGEVLKVLRIVVVARREGIEASGQAIYGRVEANVVIVWENDVKVAIELGGGEFAAAL